MLYKSLIQSLLEYTHSAWSPPQAIFNRD